MARRTVPGINPQLQSANLIILCAADSRAGGAILVDINNDGGHIAVWPLWFGGDEQTGPGGWLSLSAGAYPSEHVTLCMSTNDEQTFVVTKWALAPDPTEPTRLPIPPDAAAQEVTTLIAQLLNELTQAAWPSVKQLIAAMTDLPTMSAIAQT